MYLKYVFKMTCISITTTLIIIISSNKYYLNKYFKFNIHEISFEIPDCL